MPWDGKRRGRALPGPCPCSSCARALCASTRVRSGLTWVRWGVSCSPGLLSVCCTRAWTRTGAGATAGARILWTSQLWLLCSYGWQQSCLCCVVVLPSPSPCVPFPPAPYRTSTGLACCTLLVLEGVLLMPLSHSLHRPPSFSTDCCFPLSSSESLKVINLDIIFKSKCCKMIEARWTVWAPSLQKQETREEFVHTPRGMAWRGQGSSTPVGQESGC